MEGRLEGNFFWFWFFKERIPSYTFPPYPDYLLQNSYIHNIETSKFPKHIPCILSFLLLVITLREGHGRHISGGRSLGFVVKFKFQP